MNQLNSRPTAYGMELFVVEDIDPSSPKMGGIATYTTELLEYLVKTGIKVTVLGVGSGNSPRGEPGIISIPIIQKPKYTGYEYMFKLMMRAPFLHIPESAIIHAHHPGNMLPFSLFHRKNPKILTIHGQVLEKIRLKRNNVIKFVYQLIESYVLKHVDAVIVVDKVTAEFYQGRYPWMVKPDIIPTGIDTGKFRVMDRTLIRLKYGFKPDDKIIAYVGRLEKEKGLDFLIKCLTILKNMVPEALAVFIGDGKDKHLLEKQVKQFELNNVAFWGTREPGAIPEIMNCADVLALCSIYEGSPMVVKEALACGIPVISTDVGDVRQLVQNEKTGKIVARNENEFAQALADVLGAGDRAAISKECVATAAGYSIDLTCSRVVELYREIGNKEKNQT